MYWALDADNATERLEAYRAGRRVTHAQGQGGKTWYEGDTPETVNARLRTRLAATVSLDRLRELSTAADLSRLFVPSASPTYLRSRVRLMIVGREMAG